MGIRGLLSLLQPMMEPVDLKDFYGTIIAIDANSWLHQGARICSRDLLNGSPTEGHLKYVLNRATKLQKLNITPILVFDGLKLPMKGNSSKKRINKKSGQLKKARVLEEANEHREAAKAYSNAIQVTPDMVKACIKVLKEHNVSYLVAPYEADSQLAYMAITDQVHTVLTRDSDLIPFGCPRIIYEINDNDNDNDKDNDNNENKNKDGYLYTMSKLFDNTKYESFDKDMLLQMCILGGCDYLARLLPIEKAYDLMLKYKNYQQVLANLEKDTCYRAEQGYEDKFVKAYYIFKHSRVYNQLSEELVHLTPIPSEGFKFSSEELDFLGPMMSKEVVKDLAEGKNDPRTLQDRNEEIT